PSRRRLRWTHETRNNAGIKPGNYLLRRQEHYNASPLDIPQVNRQRQTSVLMRNPLRRINNASSPGPVMFWRQISVGGLHDGCFRIARVLGSGRPRGKPDEARRRQREDCRSKELEHRRLKEAFAPGAANGQAVVKRLPAHPHFGYCRIRIIIQPRLVADAGRELQRVEPRDIHLFTENWNERFRVNRPLFASGFDRGGYADTQSLPKASLVIRIENVGLSGKYAAEGESNAACRQIKQVGRINV